MTTSKNILLFCAIGSLFSCQNFTDGKDQENSIIKNSTGSSKSVKFVKKSSPQLLSFKQLKQLVETPKPTGKLATQYNKLLSTPFIDNSVYFRSGLPKASIHPTLGPSIRLSTWNIEKSKQITAVAEIVTSESRFKNMLRTEIQNDPEAYSEAIRQRVALASSDILLLQEMDIGHCRSGYLFAAKHLANEMNMNFVYAPQQLEIDPVHLGMDHIKFANTDVDENACGKSPGNAAKYKGVFGVAVLSRYPIKDVKLFQLQTQPYDWYEGEIKRADVLEKGRRKGAEVLFRFKPFREVKVGGRSFTRVDLHVPGLPLETLSIINIHLEIKTTPLQRRRQVEEILGYIKGIKNPVIMAGDFNSSSANVSSTSVSQFSKDTVTSPSRLLSAGLFAANVTGVNQARNIINGVKNLADPLAWSIPVILPNKTRGLFKAIEKFRFDDGGAFDFRGDATRSMHGRSGELSNSNQRQAQKGFTYTYSVPRSISVIGCQRLDWIFVKSFLDHPKDKKGSYRFAPHFGETLGLLNLSVNDPFSDHHPITTVLPLGEPPVAE